MKIRKSLYQIIAAIMIGALFIPLGSASSSSDFTNNGAGTATVGPGYTEVLVMDVTIPDGVNGGAEDIIQTSGSANIWSGDALNSFTALGSTNSTGYKEDGTGGFQGTEAVVLDLDADSVYTSGADTIITDHSDTPSAGDPLSNTWTNIRYSDNNGDTTYDNGEAIISTADANLDSGDTVITSGSADLTAFASTDWSFDNSGTDNNTYDNGEAIANDDGDSVLDSGDSITTAGKADVTNFVAGDNVLFDDSDSGNEWDSGTDDIFIDLDNDDVYTSVADSVADCDGTTTTGAGSCDAHNDGDAMVSMGANTLDMDNNGAADGNPLCTDNLSSPVLIFYDTDGDCDSDTGDDGDDATIVNILGTVPAGNVVYTTVTNAWAFVDGDADSLLDDGEDLYIEETAGEQTYSSSADTVLYNGGGALAAGDAGDEMNSDPEVIFLDSDHNGSYDDGEPLVDVGDGNTLANDGDLATSGHTVLDKASGNWTVDWVQLSVIATIGYCDDSHTNAYVDGEAIVTNGGVFADLEAADTIVTGGACDLLGNWAAQNLVHTNVGAYDNTADIIDENVDGELTWSAGADTDVYSVGGLSAGDALTDFTGDCDGGGAGSQDCKFTGSVPLDSTESILVDETNAGTVDLAADQLIGIGVRNTGTAVNSTDIAQVQVWADGGAAGFQGSGTDTLLGTMAVNSGDNQEWYLGGLTQAVSAGGLRIFVSVNLQGAPTDGRTMIFQIPVYNDAGADNVASQDNDEGVFMSSTNDGPTDSAVTNANTQTIDASPPTVNSVTPSDTMLTDSDPAIMTIAVQFNETMNTGVTPLISLIAPGPAGLSPAAAPGVWSNTGGNANDTYTQSFDFIDANENTLDVDIQVSGAQDFYGNNQAGTYTFSNAIDIDTLNPTVLSITPSKGSLADIDAGPGSLNVDVLFSESMNTGVTPTVSFSNPAAPDLTIGAGGSWSITAVPNDTYREVFNFADNNVNTQDVDIDVTGGQDANGNNQTVAGAAVDAIDIDTQNPIPTPANISISSCTGTLGECIVGDNVTMTWNAGADGWTDIASVVPVDMSQFGGPAADIAIDNGSKCGDAAGDNIWTTCYLIMGGEGIDLINRNVTITATDNVGNVSVPVPDTDNMTVDTEPPTILTPGFLTITNDVNGNGVANTGDTVTYNDAIPTTGDGDSMQVDLTTLTGTAAATNLGSPYTVTVGSLSGLVQFVETVTDDAGNTVTGNTTALNVDNRPVLTSTSVTPGNTQVNNNVAYRIKFTTASAWPANGIFEVIFPAQFDVSGLNGNTASNLVNVDGVLTAAVAGQTVTITRDGSGSGVLAGTAVTFDIGTGTNGPTAGLTGTFAFETQDNVGTTIDVDTAVPGVTLTSAATATTTTGGGSAGGSLYPPPTPGEEEEEEPSAEEEPVPLTPFPDAYLHWAESYIATAYDGGYVEGFEDGTFQPDVPTTRAEVAKLIALWNGVPEEYVCNPEAFPDVDCEEWYGIYVTYLNEIGVIEGYEDGTFRPDQQVSRAEAVKMLIYIKLLQDTDISDVLNPFSDVFLEDWFHNVVMVSYKLGIVEGYEDGTFRPNNAITRAEFTKVFVETLLNN
jgi:hypothetical protein